MMTREQKEAFTKAITATPKWAAAIAKWRAAGEMWRLDLALELTCQRVSAMLEDDLASVREVTSKPGSGLTNRQRREIYRDWTRMNQEFLKSYQI